MLRVCYPFGLRAATSRERKRRFAKAGRLSMAPLARTVSRSTRGGRPGQARTPRVSELVRPSIRRVALILA